MIFEVENVLLHALWAKRNAGRGTPAKYPSMGDRSNAVPRSFAKNLQNPIDNAVSLW